MLYLSPGTRIRAFTLVECLGRGGMSSVWRAHHAETNQDYALKVLHGNMVDEDLVRQRFFEEGLIQARVAHPNVVGIKGRIEAHPVHALVMEFIDGPTLSQYIKERPAGLFLSEVKTIATGILGGLNAAHRRGVVHRDVKPSNVLLQRDVYNITPKVTDFGIAKVKHGRMRTVTSAPLGTPHFMSPEQLRDSRKVTILTDIYSFGVTLYHMVTARYPFDHEDLNKLMIMIIRGDHPAPSQRRAGLSRDIDELIQWCMCIDADERPQTCRDVLERVLSIDWTDTAPPEALEPNQTQDPLMEFEQPIRTPSSQPSPRQRAPRPGPRPQGSNPRGSRPTSGPRRAPGPRPSSRPRRAPQQELGLPAESRSAARRAPRPAPRPHTGGSSGDPAWAQSNLGPEEDFSDRLASPFQRRSRLPAVIGVLLLLGAAGFGGKMFLDWRDDQRETVQVVESQAAIPGDPGTSVLSESSANNLLAASDPQVRPESGNDGTTAIEVGASTHGEPPQETGSDTVTPADSEGQPVNAVIQTGTGDEPSGDDQEPGADSEVETEVAEPDDDEPIEPDDDEPIEPDDDEPIEPDDDDDDDEREARRDDDDEPIEPEDAWRDDRNDDRDPSEGYSWQDSQTGRELVGRDAERAAEEAWQARYGNQNSEPDPPPNNTNPPDNSNLEYAAPTATVTPPVVEEEEPEDEEEQLNPRQINSVFGRANSQFRGCFSATASDEIEMRVRIQADGTVGFASATASGANPSIVRCLVSEISDLEFDSFDGPAMVITRTFTRVGFR